MAGKTRQRGFVLVMTLVLILIAGIALGSLCRWSLGRSLAANRQQEDLQQKWAVISYKATLLARCASVIDAAEENQLDAVGRVDIKTTLGGLPFHLIFCDEQAKANVNRLYEAKGFEGLSDVLESLLTDQQRRVSPLSLRPAPVTKSASLLQEMSAFSSYGQIFESPSALDLLGSSARQPGPSQRFTCWGNGKLHLRRADSRALDQVLSPTLGMSQIDRIRQIRGEQPGISVTRMLDLLALPDRQRKPLEKLLTDQSDCFSLWIIQEGSLRSYYHLAVIDNSGASGTRFANFAW